MKNVITEHPKLGLCVTDLRGNTLSGSLSCVVCGEIIVTDELPILALTDHMSQPCWGLAHRLCLEEPQNE